VSSSIRDSYENVPYESRPIPTAHPDCFATVATLRGMTPPPVPTARVLELGCAGGGNLMALAQVLPDARFVGVDLSPRQIEHGKRIVDAVGLTNVALHAASITDVDDSWGAFDYIVCHGVFSWVPDDVRDKILDICQRNLVPNGVAYVSYNTFPGWHKGALLRELMTFHARDVVEPSERIIRARGYLRFLSDSLPEPDSPYGRIIRSAAEWLPHTSDTYIFHEFLEDHNQPLYFEQFMERASARRLQYLGEARSVDFELQRVPPAALAQIRGGSRNWIEYEQHLDFLRNRQFRWTLLCHDDVTLNHGPQPRAIAERNLLAASALAPADGAPAVLTHDSQEFHAPFDTSLTTTQPLLKAAFACLSSVWPKAVPFDAVWTDVVRQLGDEADAVPGGDGRAFLADGLLRCYLTDSAHLVELHVCAPSIAIEPGERPMTTPLARYQSRHGADIATLNHSLADVGAVDRFVLAHLDGTRDRAALVRLLADAIGRGELQLELGDVPMTDAARLLDTLGPILDRSLTQLARSPLLVA
jgi:SAM-dependent methyltransferase/methyltransferase-like protein